MHIGSKKLSKILANDENKKRLLSLIINEWSSDTYAPLLKNRELYFVNGEECTLITSENGDTTDVRPVPELYSSQEEADTPIILHLKFVNDKERPKKVIVRSTDTDVFILLLHFSSTFLNCKEIKFETGCGDIIALCQFLGQIFISPLLGFHAFTGCDSISACVRQGKSKPLKLMLQNEDIQGSFQDVGEQIYLSEKTCK